MTRSDKSLGFKVADDGLDVVNEFAPDAKDDPVVARESGFRENYREGCLLHLHVVWGLGNWQGNAKALCARYEWLFEDLGRAIDHFTFRHEPWIDNEDGAVFIDVVEFTQDPERIAIWGTGVSLVWLRVLDRCELLRPEQITQTLDASRLFLKSLRVDEDGEIDLAKNRHVVCQRFHYRVGDVVKAGPQLVYGVSKGESGLSRWYKELGWGGTRLPLKIVVNDGCLTGVYSGAPSKDNILEVTEVFLCPLDLTLGRVK